ncbi:hypothetical protein CTAYLR_010062 [Chrysophaeum taylorii]|uniref:SAM-dependent methyltransferase n=1 Tax=Chrysophaeum taylorii TaxID=2483200 RepID=A0AAD7U9U0_9STRA|nr:hypothetical protein CTAYLR_010062 [Chrysophaeum taylorii]
MISLLLTLSPRLSDLTALAQAPWSCGGDAGSAPRGLVADIGCDHGFVAAELCARGRDVVAVDIAREPLECARAHFASLGLAPLAFVESDGLADVDAETAIVAGLGGRTAARVIRDATRRDRGPRRYVLQPTQQFLAHARDLRLALHEGGYAPVKEVWRDDNPPNSPLRRPALRRGRRFLVTIMAERRCDGASPPTAIELLVGTRRIAVDATPAARLKYIVHHRDWLASIAAKTAAETSHLDAVRSWPCRAGH